jgi:YVTN family beta-propeller protein
LVAGGSCSSPLGFDRPLRRQARYVVEVDETARSGAPETFPLFAVRLTRLFTKLSRLLPDPSIDRMSIKIDGSAFRAGGRHRSAVREDAMKLRVCGLLAAAAFVSCCLASAQTLAQNAYITNIGGWVTVIDTATNSQITTTPVGTPGVALPQGVAVTPDCSKVCVTSTGTNGGVSTVSVIDTATNTVTATISIPAGNASFGVAVTPDGSKVYVTNSLSNTVSVIATATDTVTTTVPVGNQPGGVAVTPDGSKVYVTNTWLIQSPGSVSVIDTATNSVTATIPLPVGFFPYSVAVTPDGRTAYVANYYGNALDQLHLRAVGRGNPAHMPTVVDALFEDLHAVLP